jgi:hypothetical protein
MSNAAKVVLGVLAGLLGAVVVLALLAIVGQVRESNEASAGGRLHSDF